MFQYFLAPFGMDIFLVFQFTQIKEHTGGGEGERAKDVWLR